MFQPYAWLNAMTLGLMQSVTEHEKMNTLEVTPKLGVLFHLDLLTDVSTSDTYSFNFSDKNIYVTQIHQLFS